MEDRYIRRGISGVTETAYNVTEDALGVGAGFGIGGYAGYFFENKFKPGVDATSSTGDKLVALAVNNIPKVAIWIGMRMKEPGDRDISDRLWLNAEKGVIGSVGVDIILRALNGFGPPDLNMGRKILGQKDAQRLIQENTALRENYNKALAKLSEITGMQIQSPRASITRAPPASPSLEQTPRQKKYAFMPGPAARQKKYAFMTDGVNEESVAAMIGMK